MTTVLALHRVVDRLERDHDLTWESFLRLVEGLAPGPSGGAQADLGIPRPSGAVSLTFDDGTEGHLRAAEELEARGLSATFFLPVADIGTPGRLNGEEAARLVSMGHVVGSHAYDHRPLAGLARRELEYQVRESRMRLEDLCQSSVLFFAPPGGIDHPHLQAALRAEGYRASRSMRWGIYRDPRARWRIPCVPVTEYTWRRGWVAHAVRRHSLPSSMRVGGVVKRALPAGSVTAVRGALHERVRGGRTPPR